MRKIVQDDGSVRFEVLGELLTEAEFDKRFAPRAQAPCSLSYCRPHKSDGLAVHPKQRAEAEESAKRKGVPTEFLADGRPIMRSRAHQKAYLRAYGMHNNDGGYGD